MYTHDKTIWWKLKKIYQPFESACTTYTQGRTNKNLRNLRMCSIFDHMTATRSSTIAQIWSIVFYMSFTLRTRVPMKMKDIKQELQWVCFYNEINDYTEKLQRRSCYAFTLESNIKIIFLKIRVNIYLK